MGVYNEEDTYKQHRINNITNSSANWGCLFVEKDLDVYKICLPHQCDSWCIGTIEDAEYLIKDLKAIITHIKNNLDCFPGIEKKI